MSVFKLSTVGVLLLVALGLTFWVLDFFNANQLRDVFTQGISIVVIWAVYTGAVMAVIGVKGHSDRDVS